MAKISELDDANLLKLFIGLRDKRSKRKADYDADDADDKYKQNKIGSSLETPTLSAT